LASVACGTFLPVPCGIFSSHWCARTKVL
jgi:hypothetical protein